MTPLLTTDDMHTGGEPVRIITGGWPDVPGATILDKRAHAMAQQDHLRRQLMWEPRGHFDMYGVLPVKPSVPGAVLGVLFMHNAGWSTMCGHATIALGRWCIDQGMVAISAPVTRFVIECPCGPVAVSVAIEDGRPGAVAFESVPAFAAALDQTVEIDWPGGERFSARYDLAYGGAFYAVADAAQFGLAFGRDPAARFIDTAARVTDALRASAAISHPDDPRLGFLYGTILTDGHDAWSPEPTRNICVFAERQVDRSPTGSGVTARLALMHARGLIRPGQQRIFESVTGSRFTGEIAALERNAAGETIIARVSGRAHYTGKAEFIVEEDDPLRGGFLVR